jgi:hypothetical protein
VADLERRGKRGGGGKGIGIPLLSGKISLRKTEEENDTFSWCKT